MQRSSRRVSSDRRVAAWLVLIALTIVGLVVAMVLIAPGADSGTQVIREGEHSAEDVRDAAKLLIDSYGSLVSLVSAAFGVVAFLVTFQQGRGGRLSVRAWGLLLAAVVLLSGALILAFSGRETLLAMVTHNAVDITLPVLAISRWTSYACVVMAGALTVWFAMEVGFSEEKLTDAHPVTVAWAGKEDI